MLWHFFWTETQANVELRRRKQDRAWIPDIQILPQDRLCSGFYSILWAWWFLDITPVSCPIYFEIKVLIAHCVFLCWGNLRISGLLQVLAEVENTSTAIQWSLQTQVEEQKVWITWNVDRRSMRKKRGDIIPACQAVILCTCSNRYIPSCQTICHT